MPDFIDIGPECFANVEATVISYKGENFYKTCDEIVTGQADGAASYCVKRSGHSGYIHEDYEGLTRHMVNPPQEINQFARCETIDEVLGQAVGAGSTCWNPMDCTGAFQEQRAIQIVKDAKERIGELSG